MRCAPRSALAKYENSPVMMRRMILLDSWSGEPEEKPWSDEECPGAREPESSTM